MTTHDRHWGDVLQSVPLHRQDLFAAGRGWQIEAVQNQDALLAASDKFAAFPYGLLLWDSAPVLADALVELGALAGKRVLELGAGVGLVGLAARHLGGEVVQTDHAEEALALSHRNAVLNGVSGITLRLADWSRWDMAGRFDIVIGSDILYDGSAHASVASVLDASLADDGVAVLTDPARTATPMFIRNMQRAGWRVAEERLVVDAIHPTPSVATVVVTIITIRKPG